MAESTSEPSESDAVLDPRIGEAEEFAVRKEILEILQAVAASLGYFLWLLVHRHGMRVAVTDLFAELKAQVAKPVSDDELLPAESDERLAIVEAVQTADSADIDRLLDMAATFFKNNKNFTELVMQYVDLLRAVVVSETATAEWAIEYVCELEETAFGLIEPEHNENAFAASVRQ